MNVEQASWDSDFFGIKIGKLFVFNDNDFDPLRFKEQVNDEKYKLVYIFKYKTPFSLEKVLLANIDLFDIHISLSKKFNKAEYINNPNEFRTSLSEKELHECYTIAEKTALVSRFYHEKLIGISKTKQLYRKWIDNTLNKSFSDGLFLEKNSNSVLGIHLIKTDNINKIGYFTLTGVDPDIKRMGIGRKLWNQSFGYWANESNIETIRSPFSFMNEESFNFHLKMGFNKVEEIKYIYHFRTNI